MSNISDTKKRVRGHSHASFQEEKKEHSDIKRGKVPAGTRCVNQKVGWKEALGKYRE